MDNSFNKVQLEELICVLFHIEKPTKMMLSQITRFVTGQEYGYSYLDIARSLAYFIEEQGNSPDIEKGIGIVPWVIDDARRFYSQLANEQAEFKAQGMRLREVLMTPKEAVKAEPNKRKKAKQALIDIERLG
jgi:hypothetical protein